MSQQSPLVTTGGATNVTGTSALVSGTVNAGGAATAVTVIYGVDPTLTTGTQTANATPTPVVGVSGTPVSATLNGLTNGTTYYYRFVGSAA